MNLTGRPAVKGWAVAFLLAVALFAALTGSVMPAVQAAGPQPSLSIQAPQKVKVGEPIQLTLVVRDASDIAGYETRLVYDPAAVDFDGLRQRHKDLKTLGRDVQSLGPVDTDNGVWFGLYSCPVAQCADSRSARHDSGGRGKVELATVGVVPRREGTVELRLTDSLFVDAQGATVPVVGAETTVRVQVGDARNTISAPSFTARPVTSSATSAAAGPFDLSHDGVVDRGDAALVSLAWTQARQSDAVCGSGVDKTVDVVHDGCINVRDLQTLAAHYASHEQTPVQKLRATPDGVPEADAPAVEANADDADLVIATTDQALTLAQAAPLTMVVNSTDDFDDLDPLDGLCKTGRNVCTLRAAIQQANSHLGPDTITFNIPGTGPFQINAPNGLPILTDDGTTIDGYTQPGASPNSSPTTDNARIMIQIFNSSTGAPGSTGQGIGIASSNNTIRGLSVYNYFDSALLFTTSAQNNRIVGNFLGTNADATFMPPNNPGQVNSRGGGVSLGTGAGHNQIGDTSPADRNLLSGNFGSGVTTFGEDTDYNVVYNNLIGLGRSGTNQVLNTKHGVDLNSLSSFNVIGGTSAGQRNVISGNLENGVEISHDMLTVENQIVGNYIGTDVSGNAAPAELANLIWGLHIHDGPTNNTITDNVIVNNKGGGVSIHDFENWGNHILNNRIGIGINGASIPNGQYGVQIWSNADRVTIGPGNIIANNPEGIIVPQVGSSFNTFTRNSIFNNRAQTQSCGVAGRGIDLALQDPCNPSSPPSANNGILSPQLIAASPSMVQATACANCTVEVFLADAPAATGASQTPAGQGQTFVASGVASPSGQALIPVVLKVGQVVTATATDALGDTSEFATNIAVTNAVIGSATATPIPTAGTGPFAQDSFSRSVTNGGWANGERGGTWAVEVPGTRPAGAPASDYAVNGSVGTMLHGNTSQFRSAYLTDVSVQNVDVRFRVNMDKAASSGGFLYTYAVARRADSATGNEYIGRLTVDSAGRVFLDAGKANICPTGDTCDPITFFGTPAPTSASQTPGQFIWLRMQVTGTNPTTIQLKAWNDGQLEPQAFTVTQTDSDPTLQRAGSVGVRSLVVGDGSNTPVTFSFDDFLAQVPGAQPPTSTPTLTPTPTRTPTSTSTPTPTPTSTTVVNGAAPLVVLSTPARLVDTRSSGGAISPGADRCFIVAGRAGVPADAVGVVFNATAVGQAGRGWLTLYPAGQPLPATSTLNFDSTQSAIANGAVVRLGSAGQVCVDAGQAATNVILDVTGYAPSGGAALMPLLSSPARLADTRNSGGAVQPGADRCFTVAGQAGVSANATGVLLNVTAVGYGGVGWLTLYPAGQALPSTSTLNFDPNVWAFANNATIRLGTSGRICVSAGQTSSQVILDVVGYVAPAGASQLPLLTQPQRLVDTRNSGGPITNGADRCFPIGGQGGIPANASGVLLNVTATGQAGSGWFTVYPAGQNVPATSTLNFDTSESAVANGTIVRLGTGGQLCVHAGASPAQFIADATGYVP